VTDSNEVRYIALAASSFLAHLRRPRKEMECIYRDYYLVANFNDLRVIIV